MERRAKSIPLINRWRSIKKNAKRNVKKEMIKFYNSQVCNKSIGTRTENCVVEAIIESHNGGEQAEHQVTLSDDCGQQNCGQPLISFEGEQYPQSDHLQNEAVQELNNGEKYVQELWEKFKANWNIELDEENMPDTTKNELRRESILQKIKTWASNHSITHMAISDLMKVLNEEIAEINLPIDGRTVMETPRQIKIVDDDRLGGKYWHYGLELALLNALSNEVIASDMVIHLTINIDGLPLYNSSHIEFWPILVKIFEYENIPPLIIGIYCGRGKFWALIANFLYRSFY